MKQFPLIKPAAVKIILLQGRSQKNFRSCKERTGAEAADFHRSFDLKEIITMASKQTKSALNSIKMQAASEVGVALNNGYNGDLTARQAGSIGGQMVKKMIESYEKNMK